MIETLLIIEDEKLLGMGFGDIVLRLDYRVCPADERQNFIVFPGYYPKRHQQK